MIRFSIGTRALKGILAAAIGGTVLGYSTPIDAHAEQKNSTVVAIQVAAAGNIENPYSKAALEAADRANSKLDAISVQSWNKQIAILEATRSHRFNVWRDTPPMNPDTTVNAYVEIEKGDRTKWEFDIEKNRREIDRVIDPSVGGYPTNYGFIPSTFSWDGDPFDVIVLGPVLKGGELVKGTVVGIYHMIDEKGFDPHLVISPVDDRGRLLYKLDDNVKDQVADFVNRYKIPDAHKGKWAEFIGWGDDKEGHRFLRATSGFFNDAVKKNPTIKPIK